MTYPPLPLKELKPKRSKYRNQKCRYRGMTFDSKLELQRWQMLEQFEREGKIAALDRQVLVPLYAYDRHICNLVVDFRYRLVGPDGREQVVWEDTKGFLTDEARIKLALFAAQTNQHVVLIRSADVTKPPSRW